MVQITHTQWNTVIKKNEILPFAAMWMDLENILFSEVSQAEKDNYMISLICAAQKIVEINLFPK